MSKSLTNKKKSKTKKALDPKVLGRDLTPFEEYRLSVEQGIPSNKASLGEKLEIMQNMSTQETKANWGKEAGFSKSVNTAMGIVGGIGEIANAAAANAKIKDTTEDRNNIEQFGNTLYSSSNYEDAVNQFQNREDLETYDKKNLTGGAGKQLKNVGNATLAGAKAGASFGPIGMIVGGAVGAISSGIGAMVGNSKAKKEADRLNAMAQEAEVKNTSNFNISVDNIANQSNIMDMANFAAYGRHFNKFNDGGNKNYDIEVLPIEEDTTTYEPTAIVKSNDKAYSGPIIEPFTDNYKVLSVEKTPEKWLLQRQSQYNNNLSQYLGKPVSMEESNASMLEAINRMNATPASVMEPFYDDYLDKDSWRTVKTTDTKISEATKASIARAMDKNGAGAKFLEFPKESIMYNIPLEYYPEVAPHERTHSLKLEAAENAIKNRNIKLKEGIEPDSYLDDSKEIYARLMGLRVTENLDPTKTYDIKEIKEILNKAGEQHDLGNRYSDEDLEFLFNKVAYNNPSNLDIQIPEQMQYIDPNEGRILAAYGGPIHKEFSNGVTIINEGGTHENNSHGGVQVGVDPKGVPNLVEEGEVIFNDYVFSNRLKVPDTVRKKYKLRNNKDLSFADAAKDIQKMSEEMPNDPIVKRTMELRLNQLMQEQETIRMKQNKTNNVSYAAEGGNLFYDGSKMKSILDASSVGLDVITGYLDKYTTKPDYSHLKPFENAIKAANKRVSTDPVVSNLKYKPFDTQSIYNRMQANNAANVRNIMNTSGGNAAIARASLLTNDNNFNNSLGSLWRQVEEGEYNRRMTYDKYMTDIAAGNSARKMQAQSTNANILSNQAGLWKQYADAKQNIDNITSAALSTNYNTAKQSLQGYAQQLWAENNIDNAIKNGYLIDNATGKRYNVIAETPAAKTPVVVTNTDNTPVYYTKTGPIYENSEDTGYYTKNGVFKKGGKLKRKTKRRRLS